ncbi:hypothetical protein HMPREF9489_1933 [Finegoldia magna SY403409CC001050417]|nr:hypothetical protein HMPREF9489_1933 [Finegoldia magna SY403409CC001050417]
MRALRGALFFLGKFIEKILNIILIFIQEIFARCNVECKLV